MRWESSSLIFFAWQYGSVGAMMGQASSSFCDTSVADRLHLAGKVMAIRLHPQYWAIADSMDATSGGFR
jgi:hypothetical protein